MDYTIFMKKSFLSQSVGDFSQNFEKASYKDFEQIVTNGSILGMAKIALKVCKKNVKSVFDNVDGMPINSNGSIMTRKDGYVDKDEMFQLIKTSYKATSGKEISDEKIKKLTLKQAIDLVINYFDKK